MAARTSLGTREIAERLATRAERLLDVRDAPPKSLGSTKEDMTFCGVAGPLEHRDAIGEQTLGSAYATRRLETTARYETRLDRKLERTLSMLIRCGSFDQPRATRFNEPHGR